MLRSQNLTVVSPEPLAKCRPSGLKLTASTASAWPGMEAVHLLTGRTLKMAWGWYTMHRAVSTETCIGMTHVCMWVQVSNFAVHADTCMHHMQVSCNKALGCYTAWHCSALDKGQQVCRQQYSMLLSICITVNTVSDNMPVKCPSSVRQGLLYFSADGPQDLTPAPDLQ